jgi:hypothetical protein
MIKRYLIITAILLTNLIFSYGQSVTNSPYTRFGIGEIDRNGFNHSKAMGGLSTGLRTKNQINYLNPAAISAQDTMSFLFDIGISGITKNLSTGTSDLEYNNFAFDHLAMSFPIKSWWFASVGITPYSKIGYNIQQVSEFEYIDSVNVYNAYYGKGGINQIFLSNSFNLSENFSVGLNLNFLFGSIEQYDQIYTDRPDFYSTIVEDKILINDINFDLGVQYHKTIQNDYFLVAGLVYSSKTTFNSTRHTTVFMAENYALYGENVYTYLNDFESTFDTISTVAQKNYKIEVPAKYSVGFSFGKIDKFTVGVDYSYQDWTGAKSFSDNKFFDSDHLVNVGFEYTPNKYSIRNYFNHISYRTGFYYNDSYLTINNKQINNYGITFGLGFPLGNQRTSLNMSYTYGKRGTTENDLIEEVYSSFGINLTLYDFWFIKRKFQ